MARIVLVTLTLLASCIPRTVSYNNVRITNDPTVPEKCVFLGMVSSGGNTLAGIGNSADTPTIEASSTQDPITGLRQATADFGGNTVVVTDSEDNLAGSSVSGDAFDCAGYNPQ